MTIDIGPPNYKLMLHPVIKDNYGKWKYHETLEPGVLVHVSDTGDEVYTVRVGSPRLVSVDFIREICDIADKHCDGYLRFTSRHCIEFMVPDKARLQPLIEEIRNMTSLSGAPEHQYPTLSILRDGFTVIALLRMPPDL